MYAAGPITSSSVLYSKRRYGDAVEHDGYMYMIAGTASSNSIYMERVKPGYPVEKDFQLGYSLYGPCTVKISPNSFLMVSGYGTK